MKRSIRIALLILAILSLNCQAPKNYQPIPMRKLAYAMPEDHFRISTIDSKIFLLKQVRINPEQNIITGIDEETGSTVKIFISSVDTIEEEKKR